MANCAEKIAWKIKSRLKRFKRQNRPRLRRATRWCLSWCYDEVDIARDDLIHNSVVDMLMSKERNSDDEGIHDDFIADESAEQSVSAGVTLFNRLPVGWNKHERDVRSAKRRRKNIRRLCALVFLVSVALLTIFYTVDVFSSYDDEISSLRDSVDVGDGAFVSMWYHAHIDLLSHSDVNELARDADLSAPCRKITYAEYVTRFLGHDAAALDELLDEPSDAGTRRYGKSMADLDVDLLTHMLCHVAYDLHKQDPDRPMYVTPKMLNVSEFHVAAKFRGAPQDKGEFAVYDHYDAENLCIMAYIRPGDDAAAGEEDEDHSHGVAKVYEAALNITDDVFVHSTSVGLAREDDRSRYYVYRNDSEALYDTRTWWNSALFADGKPGECVLYVNPEIRVGDDSGRLEVVRSSMLVDPPAVDSDEESKVLFSSKVWKHASIDHDMVLDRNPPDLVAFEADLFGAHDDVRTTAARHEFPALEQSVESQIVLDMLHGRWNIFDEIRRAMKADV